MYSYILKVTSDVAANSLVLEEKLWASFLAEKLRDNDNIIYQVDGKIGKWTMFMF